MARRPLHVIDRGATFVVRGNALTVLRDGGFRAPYVGTVKGWILDDHRARDFLSYCDHRGVSYVVTEARGAA